MSSLPRTGRSSRRPPTSAHPQRGIVLFIALLVMVGLAIAGVALMRSTDTATTVTGNLVLKQAASSAVDRGVERAIHALWEIAPVLDRTQHAPAQNFYACIRATTGGCMAANGTVPKIPDLLLNTNGCSVGSSEPVTADASRFSTSARYRRALRCGGGSRKLDHRFSPYAPVRTASRTSNA